MKVAKFFRYCPIWSHWHSWQRQRKKCFLSSSPSQARRALAPSFIKNQSKHFLKTTTILWHWKIIRLIQSTLVGIKRNSLDQFIWTILVLSDLYLQTCYLMCQSRPLFIYFGLFHIAQFKYKLLKAMLGVLGTRTWVEAWKVQTNPLSYGGTPWRRKFS